MSGKRKWVDYKALGTRRKYGTKKGKYTTPFYKSVNVEKKFIQTLLSATNATYCTDGNIANSGTGNGMVLVNPTSVGTTASSRIGRQYTITSIFYRIKITYKQANVDSPSQVCRTAVVQDLQVNGSSAVIADIFVPIFIGPNEVLPYSPMNLNNSHRFRVISDEVRTLLHNGASGSGPTSVQTANICWIENYIPCNIKVLNNTTTTNGDQRDIITNAVYMCFIGQFPKIDNDAAIAQGYVRIRYTDD